jgi:hypothetical protein
MIRIDEIYNHTFWPWLEQHRPGTRLFFCDPPGNTGADALFNLGREDMVENDYVFMHDQEPVDLDLYHALFDEVKRRNTNIGGRWADETKQIWMLSVRHLTSGTYKGPLGHVVVSERGECVDELCSKYGWIPHYYFYHAWACLDWFRGYDRTFLIPRAKDRSPKKTFISPNRIVAGKRDHRVLFLYNIFKNNLENNHISAPRRCPYEGVDIAQVASKYCNTYADIEQVFNRVELPRLFEGEATQLMHSYQLGNFKEAADSLVYVATETVYFGKRQHLTEKTFKAIALEMPFVLVATQGSLAYLREYGFKTFSPYIDETYDLIEDPVERIEAVTAILLEIQARSAAARQELWQHLLPRVEHNYNHFYRGGLTDVLWAELTAMLQEF